MGRTGTSTQMEEGEPRKYSLVGCSLGEGECSTYPSAMMKTTKKQQHGCLPNHTVYSTECNCGCCAEGAGYRTMCRHGTSISSVAPAPGMVACITRLQINITVNAILPDRKNPNQQAAVFRGIRQSPRVFVRYCGWAKSRPLNASWLAARG